MFWFFACFFGSVGLLGADLSIQDIPSFVLGHVSISATWAGPCGGCTNGGLRDGFWEFWDCFVDL